VSAYRTSALAVVKEVHEHRGPRKACPACGYDNQYILMWGMRSCTGASWLGRLLGGCKRETLHLHQQCYECKAKWIVAPKEDL
jgi:hypothetical protein